MVRNPFGKKEEKQKFKGTSSEQREIALASIAQRLGSAETWDERAQNAFIHYSLPVHTSYARAFENRMRQLIIPLTVTVTGCSCDKQPCEKHIGEVLLLKRPLFLNTMTLTEWITNYFQESPSVNARARQDQVELAKAGYAVPAIMGMQPFGGEITTPQGSEDKGD